MKYLSKYLKTISKLSLGYITNDSIFLTKFSMIVLYVRKLIANKKIINIQKKLCVSSLFRFTRLEQNEGYYSIGLHRPDVL